MTSRRRGGRRGFKGRSKTQLKRMLEARYNSALLISCARGWRTLRRTVPSL